MALRPKPQQASEAAVNALIDKGGSIATNEKSHPKTRNFQLRLTDEVRLRIDRACQKHRVKLSWHAYIMDAVLEKLEKDEQAV